MSLTERETATKNQYNLTAEKWLQRSGGANRPCFWADELVDFENSFGGSNATETKNNSLIVEIGSGPATDGKYLESLGFKTVSFDYSKTMVDLAKRMRPESNIAQMNTYSTGFADNSFDGFLAVATILHLENPQKALKEIVRITKDKGIGFISVKEGHKEDSGTDSSTGYYFHYFASEEFTTLLENTGFDIIKEGAKTGTPRHEWLTYLVRVNKW